MRQAEVDPVSAEPLEAPLAGDDNPARSVASSWPFGRHAYLAATGISSAYISGSTVSRQVISRGKIFSIARAE
jgi:hypothetical protein